MDEKQAHQVILKPWTGAERLYFYRQSQQLAGQTGQIGKLRADFDRDGNGFFSSWEDIRNHLKSNRRSIIRRINARIFAKAPIIPRSVEK